MMKPILAAAFLAGSLIGAPAYAQLRAGAGRVSITPPAEAFPFTYQREKPFVGVHDDIFARAIVLDNDGVRIVIVSLEVTAVPEPAQTVKAIAAAIGLPESQVMVMATHTHSVPSTFMHGDVMDPVRRREYDRVRDGAIAAARGAIAALQPARIAFKRGEAYVNMNNGEASGAKGWFDPKGFSDKSLDVVRIEGADGKPLAIMLNYATHAEVMFRSVTRDGGYEITGDLPGATSRILENDARGAPVVLFAAGAEGDQLSLFKSLQPADELPGSDEGAGGWSLQNLLARRLAVGAIAALNAMPAGLSSARIAAVTGTAVCPGQKFDMGRSSGKIPVAQDSAPVAIPLQLFRIGDIVIAGVAGDLASEIGFAIKKASPVANTSIATMLAGSVGYILTDAAFINPGHGALGSKIKPGCAQTALPKAVAALARQTSK